MQSEYFYAMALIFNIGDRVSVLDAALDGIVQAVDNDIITVETVDGFLMEFQSAELVLKTVEQKDFSKYIDIQHEKELELATGPSKKTKQKLKITKKQVAMEVDLHIHHLTNSVKGLSNFEMLTIQLDTAKKRLEFAIKKRIPRVVFIHGVGEGILKTELHYLLAKYPVDIFPASFQKYGFGATEVYIYQNASRNRN